jgi:hypothetical protein
MIVFGLMGALAAVGMVGVESAPVIAQETSGIERVAVDDTDDGSGGSFVVAAENRSKCRVKRRDHGGFRICPKRFSNRDIGDISAQFSSQDAEFFCAWGEGCNAIGYSAPGTAYADWFGIKRDQPNRQLVVAQFMASCSASGGCVWETWWNPPDRNWKGAAVSMYSDDFTFISECFCDDLSPDCVRL